MAKKYKSPVTYIDVGAEGCEIYRNELHRRWSILHDVVGFVGLNPSTANATEDDPTIIKCVKYANRWGMGGMVMLNLFSYKSTDPKGLRLAQDPVGPAQEILENYIETGMTLIACWGTNGSFKNRGPEILKRFPKRFKALRLSKNGHPWHPLYLPDAIEFKDLVEI